MSCVRGVASGSPRAFPPECAFVDVKRVQSVRVQRSVPPNRGRSWAGEGVPSGVGDDRGEPGRRSAGQTAVDRHCGELSGSAAADQPGRGLTSAGMPDQAQNSSQCLSLGPVTHPWIRPAISGPTSSRVRITVERAPRPSSRIRRSLPTRPAQRRCAPLCTTPWSISWAVPQARVYFYNRRRTAQRTPCLRFST